LALGAWWLNPSDMKWNATTAARSFEEREGTPEDFTQLEYDV